MTTRTTARTSTVAAKMAAAKAASAASLAADRQGKAKQAAILLKHVSDSTRLQVILALSEGEHHVGALCQRLNQSQPAVSHHLALLRHGGVIEPRRQGKNNFYRLTNVGGDLARIAQILVP